MKEKIISLLKWFDIRKFIKFGFIGVLNTLVDLGSYYVFNKLLFIGPYVSQVLSFLIAAVNSFLWNKYWTFEKRAPATKKEVLRFAITQSGYLLCSLVVMKLMIDGLHLDSFLAKFPTAALMIFYNYLMSKLWVFVD